jgi:hypothetical protein
MRALPQLTGPGPTSEPASGTGSSLAVLSVSALLVLLVLRSVGLPAAPAAAVQPYAPRGIAAASVPTADWFALAVRASGFRPNTTVLVDVDGVGQRVLVADAAGVVDVRVELPDRIGVEVRGVALEGGGLELRQEVLLVRRDGATRTLLLAVLAAMALVAAVLAPRVLRRPADGAPLPAGSANGPGIGG